MCQEQTHPSEPHHPSTCTAVKRELCTLCPFLHPPSQAHVLTLCPGTTRAWGGNHCHHIPHNPARQEWHPCQAQQWLLPGLCCSISHHIMPVMPMVTITRTTHPSPPLAQEAEAAPQVPLHPRSCSDRARVCKRETCQPAPLWERTCGRVRLNPSGMCCADTAWALQLPR